MNIQDKFPLRLTGLISLLPKGLSRVFSDTAKASILQHSAFFMAQLSHPYMTTEKKNIALTIWTIDYMTIRFLHFDIVSKFVTTFFFPGASDF